MKKILFVSKGASSASTRYRCLAFFDHLRQCGFIPRHMGIAKKRMAVLRAAAGADVVVLLRKTFSAPYFYLLRHVSRRMIFDFDDAVFCSSKGLFSATRRRRFTRAIRHCDQIWAGNRFLAETAATTNPEVSIVPTVLDPDRYAGNTDKPKKTVDLVWIGSRSTGRYLKDHLPTLEKMAAEIPHLRLKVVADFSLKSNVLSIEPVPWSQDTEVAALQSAHIGIAPMPDNDWTRGKCALKILQYMAAGLPVISSSVGANREVVLPGRTGFLASDPQQWVDAAAALATNALLQKEMGAEGRRRIHQYYSRSTVFDTMRRDLDKLADPG